MTRWAVADVAGRVMLDIGNYAFVVQHREQDGAGGRAALVSLLTRQIEELISGPTCDTCACHLACFDHDEDESENASSRPGGVA